jgi:membrane protein implicated in regulation of membrane protease activity
MRFFRLHPHQYQIICFVLALAFIALLFLFGHTLLILFFAAMCLVGDQYRRALEERRHPQDISHRAARPVVIPALRRYLAAHHEDRVLRSVTWTLPLFILSFIGVGMHLLLLGAWIYGVWMIVSPIVFCALALRAKRALQQETAQATIHEIVTLASAVQHGTDAPLPAPAPDQAHQ